MRPNFNGHTIGDYYDPADESGAPRRFARMHYFNIICQMKPEVIHSLAACYNENAAVMPYLQAFNAWDSLCAMINIRRNYTPKHFDPGYSFDQLVKLKKAIEEWSANNGLCDLEDWILDLGLSQLEQWLWRPRMPHTHLRVPNADALPYAYWWGMGVPELRAYPDARLNFSLVNFALWEEEHEPFTSAQDKWGKAPLERLTYNNLVETRAHARERILKAFNKALDAHLDEVDQEAESRGYLRTESLKRRKTHRGVIEPYVWLYHRHFKKETVEEVAEVFGERRGKSLSASAVSQGTSALAKLIGVSL